MSKSNFPKPTWKDITPYERGEKGNVPPRAQACGVMGVSLLVRNAEENGYLTTFLGNEEKLNAENWEEAKCQALQRLCDWLSLRLDAAVVALEAACSHREVGGEEEV